MNELFDLLTYWLKPKLIVPAPEPCPECGHGTKGGHGIFPCLETITVGEEGRAEYELCGCRYQRKEQK